MTTCIIDCFRVFSFVLSFFLAVILNTIHFVVLAKSLIRGLVPFPQADDRGSPFCWHLVVVPAKPQSRTEPRNQESEEAEEEEEEEEGSR
jgi:hypothetical protein